MLISFSSVEDFNESLSEVRIILRRAEKSQAKRKEYDICIKSALLFLVAKFEAFLENLVSDYIQIIENKELCPADLPDVLKLHYADKLINDKFISELRNHKPSALRTITRLSQFCMGQEAVNSIDIDTSFDYGKHGQKAINKLFSRIGIEDIFSTCTIYEMRETLTGNTRVYIDIVGDINALTNHRNRILHTDITPSVTHQQINAYHKHLAQFSKKVGKVLELKLDCLHASVA